MNLKREKNHVRVGIKLKSETNTTQQDIPMFLAPASNLNVIKKIQIFHMYRVHINESKNNCTKHLPGE